MDYIINKDKILPVEPPTPQSNINNDNDNDKDENKSNLTLQNLIYKDYVDSIEIKYNNLLQFCNKLEDKNYKLEDKNYKLIKENSKLRIKVDKLYDIYDIVILNK
tara:strand:+ start:298 stop:612 length:315 start_codon:yes stop_codon:yes gene_type:complete